MVLKEPDDAVDIGITYIIWRFLHVVLGWTESETHYSTPYSTKVKNNKFYTSIPQQFFMAWLLIKNRKISNIPATWSV
jgi:hypothetical protein